MLKHHARRLARRLIILLALVAALAAASPGPVERKAQAAGEICYTDFSPENGGCIRTCCGPGYCYSEQC
jgi:hypothetical protein